MSITSFTFMLFVGVSLCIYFVMPAKWQWVVLLVDNLIFYFLNATPSTFIYLGVGIVSTYMAALFFEKMDIKMQNLAKEEKAIFEKKKKRILVLTILLNVGILAILKYTNLLLNTVSYFCVKLGKPEIPTVHWIASLGISFYTLQLVSYLLDCYWKIVKPEKNLLKYALFASYFPQMISGPISRYAQIGHQFFEQHTFEYDRVNRGLKRIVWGMFKKMVIATRLGQYVDMVYANLDIYQGMYVWFAVLIYPFQLYTDFSGCMDVIMGVSECFGIYLPDNFNAPFFSKTVQEFWQRFHITLGTWLKDYIMYPILKSGLWNKMGKRLKRGLGKKWGKKIPTWLGMLFLWLCMGIWHGNSWKYVIGEGVWFWFIIVLGQVMEPLTQKISQKLQIKTECFSWRLFQILRTYFIYCIGILFFRADSIKHALKVLLATLPVRNFEILFDGNLLMSAWNWTDILILLFSMGTLFIVDRMKYRGVDVREKLQEQNMVFRWGVYFIVTFIVLFSMSMSSQDFIYARF